MTDWASVWLDIAGGLIIAGALAARRHHLRERDSAASRWRAHDQFSLSLVRIALKSERVTKFFEHLNRVNCDHPTNRNKFDNIDPSLAALVFSDK